MDSNACLCLKQERTAADGAARPLAAIAEQEEAQSEVPKDQAPAKKIAKSGKTGILRFLVPAAEKAPQTSLTGAQTRATAPQGDSIRNVKSGTDAGAKSETEANAKAGVEYGNESGRGNHATCANVPGKLTLLLYSTCMPWRCVSGSLLT